MNWYYANRVLLFSIAAFTAAHLRCDTSLEGDTGSAQTGILFITGGASGAVFDTSQTGSIIEKFYFLNLPYTSSVDGQILIGEETVLHTYGPGSSNLFVGGGAGNFTNTGSGNVGCGEAALYALTSGVYNVAVGHGSLVYLTSGVQNTAVGDSAGISLVSGSGNTMIGADAGSNYSGSESNNICIASSGTQGESNILRIGQGGSMNACYIDGIYSESVDPSTFTLVYVDETGKLGTVVPKVKVKDEEGALQLLLLNELQKQAACIEALQNTIRELTQRIEDLEFSNN